MKITVEGQLSSSTKFLELHSGDPFCIGSLENPFMKTTKLYNSQGVKNSICLRDGSLSTFNDHEIIQKIYAKLFLKTLLEFNPENKRNNIIKFSEIKYGEVIYLNNCYFMKIEPCSIGNHRLNVFELVFRSGRFLHDNDFVQKVDAELIVEKI